MTPAAVVFVVSFLYSICVSKPLVPLFALYRFLCVRFNTQELGENSFLFAYLFALSSFSAQLAAHRRKTKEKSNERKEAEKKKRQNKDNLHNKTREEISALSFFFFFNLSSVFCGMLLS